MLKTNKFNYLKKKKIFSENEFVFKLIFNLLFENVKFIMKYQTNLLAFSKFLNRKKSSFFYKKVPIFFHFKLVQFKKVMKALKISLNIFSFS